MLELLVSALMSTPIISILPHTRLPEIKTIMQNRTVRRLPVVDRQRLVGIITLSDVHNDLPVDLTTLSIHEVTHLLYRVTAEDIMRREVITIGAGQTVMAAIQQMLLHHVRGLPVLQEGQLVGMLTEHDIFRAIILGPLAIRDGCAVVPHGAVAPDVDRATRQTEVEQP
jgi:acetoin utilization protein AcuB